MDQPIFIDGATRISTVLKANKESIGAIAALAKPLEKLRNPLLRKVMAPRVTLAEAADMGGCSLQDLREALAPLGFVWKEPALAPGQESATAPAPDPPSAPTPDPPGGPAPGPRPAWLSALPGTAIVYFDVRAIIAAGSDPLKEILRKFKSVEEGHALCIINSFIPIPLVRLLEKDQTLSYTEKPAAGEYHSFFLKKRKAMLTAGRDGGDCIPAKHAAPASVIIDDERSFTAAYAVYGAGRILELDVRQLEMPQPMERILEALRSLPDGHALYVHHKRVPVYLLEELADKDHTVHILTLSPTDTRLLIFKITNHHG